jgi:3-phenylpropionate/cinnamic acid dioxygenase small subunit
MTTTVSTEQELLRIPENLFVDADLRVEVEQFLYFEATLLDERRYGDWYLLFADDIHYWMPNRMNRLMQESDRENTAEREMGLFDENKTSLGWRVKQVLTRKHWAEDPPSRARHLVTNIRIEPAPAEDEYAVRSNFLVYRNRLEDEVDIWVGERHDVLRRLEPRAWQIARRTIILDQNVVLSKNLSIFL